MAGKVFAVAWPQAALKRSPSADQHNSYRKFEDHDEELTKQIVDYSYDISFEDLPADVIDRTKQLILDAIGCGFGGISSEPARIACRVAAHVRSDMGATVLGTGQQTSPDLAAFASGVMIRYLDYNDSSHAVPSKRPLSADFGMRRMCRSRWQRYFARNGHRL
ncbi:MAG: MmgE/PrpD family protein [Pseudolabrys sp.]